MQTYEVIYTMPDGQEPVRWMVQGDAPLNDGWSHLLDYVTEHGEEIRAVSGEISLCHLPRVTPTGRRTLANSHRLITVWMSWCIK